MTDFLDKATVPVGEFWLPGSWSDALEVLLTAPGQFMEELREEILGEHGDRELLEALSSSEDQRVDRALSDLWGRADREGHPAGDSNLDVRAAGFPAVEIPSVEVERAFGRVREALRRRSRNEVVRQSLQLIETAERIRKIAASAARRRTPVRWFDYSRYRGARRPSGG